MDPVITQAFTFAHALISLPWGLVIGVLMSILFFWRGLKVFRNFTERSGDERVVGFIYLGMGTLLAAGPSSILDTFWALFLWALFLRALGLVIYGMHWWAEGAPIRGEQWKLLGWGLVKVETSGGIDPLGTTVVRKVLPEDAGPSDPNDPISLPTIQFRLRGSLKIPVEG